MKSFMIRNSYLLETGSGCVAAGLATGTEGCTAVTGMGMPVGGHTGFGIIPADMPTDIIHNINSRIHICPTTMILACK